MHVASVQRGSQMTTLRRPRGGNSLFHHTLYSFAVFASAAAALLLGAFSAHALPSYARQTGQQCAACHNGFPELTPYGRLFKLNGYTFGGGQSSIPPIAVMAIGSFTR